MQTVDLSKSLNREKVPPGTLLFPQGSMVNSILVLQSGMAAMMSCEDFSPDMQDDPDALIQKSIRVGLVKGQTITSLLGLYQNKPLENSLVTVSECVITNTPIEGGLIVQTLQKNMKLNLQVLQALISRIESANFLFTNYKLLWEKLSRIQDSIALSADLGEIGEPEAIPDRYETGIEEYRNFLHHQIEQLAMKPPESWDPNTFLGSFDNELDLYTEYDNIRIEQMIDHSQYLFFKRLLRKEDRLVSGIFYKDEPTNFYVFQFLSSSLENIMQRNLRIARNISKLSTILYGEGGWAQRIINMSHEDNYRYRLFRHYLWKFSWRCHRDAIKLLNKDFTEEFPVYKSLLDYRTLPKGEASAGKSESDTRLSIPTGGIEIAGTDAEDAFGLAPENLFSSPRVDSGQLSKYRDLFNQILDFADFDQTFRDEFTELHEKVKALPELFSTEKEHINLRDQFSEKYWELYERCFLKVIDTDLKNFIPGVMLHFGLLDETLVSEEELIVIDNLYGKMMYVDHPLPAMTLPYFLEKIYTGEVGPSINEFGETYREFLKKQEKMTPKERAAALRTYGDSPEDKVRYEIYHVSIELAKMLSGSKRKFLPILTSEALVGPIDRIALDAETLSEKAEFFHQRDFSLFYREVVCKHQYGTDIVRNEVLPNFVIFPVAGSRMMMWQELDGPKKESSARFMVPLYFTEKIEESIANLLAQFRWELSRTVAGPNWMDPVEGGLSGAYYDYIQFYKKNPNLSPAHKEKLREFIKKTRSDRERFSADYQTWLMYEYEGKLRFNSVARDLFYRHVPFDLEMRKDMSQKPLYTDLDTKYKNRQNKELLRLESRMKKFEKSGADVPEQMKKYMEFLNS